MQNAEPRAELAAGRTQHVIHILPRDEELAAAILRPGLGRVDASDESLQALVIAPDRDAAWTLAAAVNTPAAGIALLKPITSPARGLRILREKPRALCASAADLLALSGQSALKLESVHTIAIVWGDDQGSQDQLASLTTLLAEAPRDADRLLLATDMSPALEEFATGFLWRARRVQHEGPASPTPTPLEYVPCPADGRGDMTRLLLDRLDPATTSLVVFTERGQADAARLRSSLGYGDDDGAVRLAQGRAGATDLAVVFELPEDLSQLAGANGDAARTIALVPPHRAVSFAEAMGASAALVQASQALRDAYTARDHLRDEIGGTLRGRALHSEVLALEPILAERDPVLVAAALLRLLETERAKVRKVSAPATPTPPATGRAGRSGSGTVHAAVHQRRRTDGLRRGDLVGAITGEAGITGAQVGKIELGWTPTPWWKSPATSRIRW
ncbi:MAG: DbpA RNA binding domain-containing protein [Gemmatimonadaceae bacterium]